MNNSHLIQTTPISSTQLDGIIYTLMSDLMVQIKGKSKNISRIHINDNDPLLPLSVVVLLRNQIVTKENQLKVGDKITIVGKSTSDDQRTTVKDVIKVNGNEEIIINKSQNKYFITQMLLDGSSWAKQVLIRQSSQ